MDDFEKAILFAFSQDGSVAGELKQQAQSYLAGVKGSPQGWEMCLSRFDGSAYVEVKFWCIQTLHELVRSGYRQLAPPAQLQVGRAGGAGGGLVGRRREAGGGRR